mgnify:FL=1|tara:strand:+ start:274 stop:774 length:501 start_codon:yes stop_codon:yes gene_type:complete
MVIWIIGKSGSGKTYLSKHLIKSLKKKKLKKIIWIDGDKFRKKYSKDLGYSLVDRKKNSKRIQNFCKKYDEKGYLVICSILSIFKNHQKINRKKFSNYFQIYIKTGTKILKFRNNKMVYSKKKNVVGKDIPFPEPYKSNLIIKNNFKKTFLNNIKKIENKIYAKIL